MKHIYKTRRLIYVLKDDCHRQTLDPRISYAQFDTIDNALRSIQVIQVNRAIGAECRRLQEEVKE